MLLGRYFVNWFFDLNMKNLEYAELNLESCNVNLLGNWRQVKSKDLLGYEVLQVWSSTLLNFTHILVNEWTSNSN